MTDAYLALLKLRTTTLTLDLPTEVCTKTNQDSRVSSCHGMMNC